MSRESLSPHSDARSFSRRALLVRFTSPLIMSLDQPIESTHPLETQDSTNAAPEETRQDPSDAETTSTTSSSSIRNNGSTWQDQLNLARSEIAQKVKEQQERDGWDFAEIEEEPEECRGGPELEEPVSTERERRESVVTDDGDDDQVVAELLRPGSRTGSDSKVEPEEEDPKPDASGSEAQETKTDKPAGENDGNGANDKVCRICFDSEDDELGKLFSPCRCRGTVSLRSRFLASPGEHRAEPASFSPCSRVTYIPSACQRGGKLLRTTRAFIVAKLARSSTSSVGRSLETSSTRDVSTEPLPVDRVSTADA